MLIDGNKKLTAIITIIVILVKLVANQNPEQEIFIPGSKSSYSIRCEFTNGSQSVTWYKYDEILKIDHSYMDWKVNEEYIDLFFYKPDFIRDSGIYHCNNDKAIMKDDMGRIFPKPTPEPKPEDFTEESPIIPGILSRFDPLKLWTLLWLSIFAIFLVVSLGISYRKHGLFNEEMKVERQIVLVPDRREEEEKERLEKKRREEEEDEQIETELIYSRARRVAGSETGGAIYPSKGLKKIKNS